MLKKRVSSVVVVAALSAVATVLGLGASDALTSGDGSPSASSPDTASASRVREHPNVRVDGQDWTIASYRNAVGELCIREVVPGEGQGVGCIGEDQLFPEGPIDLHVGARQRENSPDLTRWDNVWIWGVVNESVATVKLVLSDCAERPLPVAGDGIFFAVFGSQHLHRNVWPKQLAAYDASGNRIMVREIPLSPPPTDEARRTGTKAPKLQTC